MSRRIRSLAALGVGGFFAALSRRLTAEIAKIAKRILGKVAGMERGDRVSGNGKFKNQEPRTKN